MRGALLVAIARIPCSAKPPLAEEYRLVGVPEADEGFSQTMAELRYEISLRSSVLGDLHRIPIVLERGLTVTLGEITVTEILEADGLFTWEVCCSNRRKRLEEDGLCLSVFGRHSEGSRIKESAQRFLLRKVR